VEGGGEGGGEEGGEEGRGGKEGEEGFLTEMEEVALRRQKREAALEAFKRSASSRPPSAPPSLPPSRSGPGKAGGAPTRDANKLTAMALRAKMKGDSAGCERLMGEAAAARELVGREGGREGGRAGEGDSRGNLSFDVADISGPCTGKAR
jgi:hypothetical protein